MDKRYAGHPTAIVFEDLDGRRGTKALVELLWGDMVQIEGERDDDFVRVRCRIDEGTKIHLGWMKRDSIQKEPLLEVMFVDADQGDGCVFITPDRRIVVFDAGGTDNLFRFLRYRFMYPSVMRPVRLDAAIISRPDSDHYQGFQHIFRAPGFTFDTVYHNGLIEHKGRNRLGSLSDGKPKVFTDLVNDKEQLKAFLDSEAKVKGRALYADMLRRALNDGKFNNFKMLSRDCGFVPGFGTEDDLSIEVIGPVIEIDGHGRPGLRKFGGNLGETKEGHSISLRLTYGNTRIFFGGELNLQSESFLLESLLERQIPRTKTGRAKFIQDAREQLEVDIAKICQHGGTNYSLLLDALHPLATVTSTGSAEHSRLRTERRQMISNRSRGQHPLIFTSEELHQIGASRHRNLADLAREIMSLHRSVLAAKKKDERTKREIEFQRQVGSLFPVASLLHLRTDGRKAIIGHEYGSKRPGDMWDLRQMNPDSKGRLVTMPMDGTSSAMEVDPLGEPPVELVNAIQQGDCVGYLGSGLSVPAGVPHWPLLLSLLVDECRDNGLIDRTKHQYFVANLANDEETLVADLLAENTATDWATVVSLLARIVSLPTKGRITPYHEALSRLPLAGVLTTAFDRIVDETLCNEKTPRLTPSDAKHMLPLLAGNKFFVLRTCGDLSRADTVILSPGQFDSTISQNREFEYFLSGLLSSSTFLFLGTSLRSIGEFLERCGASSRSPRTHWAVVAVDPQDASWSARAEWLKTRFGLRILPFSLVTGFEQLEVFLEQLVAAVGPDAMREIRSRPSPTLRSISLTNIGPYDSLHIDLTPGHNVLLGDNGVGKSTILRAIAVAMSAEDGRHYAHRLMRCGANHAEINLEWSDNRIHRAEIHRTPSSVDITVEPRRPLESRGLLAVGFPPSRALSYATTDTTTEAIVSSPTVRDLIPLMEGIGDIRPDRLREWLVQHCTEPDLRTLTRAGADVFKVLGKLAGAMRIEFDHVNPDEREVYVKTGDAIIPLGAVSQGTASLFSWVGVLVRRLHEVYHSRDNALHQPALVLIDEIDAHMHPVWQQDLLADLKGCFPAVQFIATTHSPLIVGGLQADQVKRLVRNEDRITAVPLDDEMLIGRANHLLSSPLFGLTTTLDARSRAMIDKYRKLRIDNANPKELAELRKQIGEQMPPVADSYGERLAEELIDKLIKARLGSAFETEEEELRDSAFKLLDASRRMSEGS